MKKKYVVALGVFMTIVMVTLIFQYKHFKFQTYHINSYHGFNYSCNADDLKVEDYYAAVSSYYGGAKVYLNSEETVLLAQVILEDTSVLNHTLTKQEDGSYLMDVLNEESQRSKPTKIVITTPDGIVLNEANVVSGTGPLYQYSSYDFAFLNIYINQSGIFMGQFEAFDKAQLLENYQAVTIEFCHPDASKSSGYQLLARTQLDITDFLEKDNLGYLPFLPTAHFDTMKTIDVIITFEGNNRQAIVMTLEKGVQ